MYNLIVIGTSLEALYNGFSLNVEYILEMELFIQFDRFWLYCTNKLHMPNFLKNMTLYEIFFYMSYDFILNTRRCVRDFGASEVGIRGLGTSLLRGVLWVDSRFERLTLAVLLEVDTLSCDRILPIGYLENGRIVKRDVSLSWLHLFTRFLL